VSTSSGGTYADAAGTCAPATTNASTAVSCIATGLTNSTPYFFKVAAINSVSTGSYSLASSGLTPVAPPLTYSVTYNPNGFTGGSPPIDSGAYANGATVTVLGNTGTLVKTGYTFSGWNTAADGTGTAQAVGTSFSMGSAAVTLFAQWTAVALNAATSIPTLSEWGVILLSILMLIVGIQTTRSRPEWR